ncbi:MAG: peptide ABC transporter substrate-binding protein [Chloroflexi bacterium]|nr:MAG: peptide ABC transporter substrate-binding protein [Chloroflexota bacterium]
MTRPSGRLPRFATLLAGAAIVVAACTPAASNAPSTGATAGPTTAATGAAAIKYPATGEVTCPSGATAGSYNGTEYKGNLKSIEAPDASTVIFNLCAPDVAFLQKIAFSVFYINDSAWIEKHAADGTIKDTMNGTGPYKLDAWNKGTELTFSKFDNYWNKDKYPLVPNAVLRWSKEAGARLQALQGGQVTGITLVGPNDFDTVKNDPNLLLAPAPEGQALNTLYLGMNHDDKPWDKLEVRKAVALAIDRQRIVTNFYPAGSEVATHFTPCAIKYACEGPDWPSSGTAADIQKAKDLLTQAGFPNGFKTKIQYRNVFRGYLPQPPVVAQDLKEQLAKIGIDATVEEQESGTLIANANSGKLDGLFLLGWGADYPEVTNFMDYHFGGGCTAAFGTCYPDIATPLGKGNSTTDDAARKAAYTEANTKLIDDVPMVPIAHGQYANAYLAGTEGTQVSAISTEVMWAMKPPSTATDPNTVVLMQNAEPIGVYCADETDGESLRACEQSMEGLYGYAVGGTDVVPVLATSCDPNTAGTQWTCKLRQGVTFHDGSTFDAQDVVLSFAVQWDAAHPLHKGDTGIFEYWGGLWGGNLNPPPPATPAPS